MRERGHEHHAHSAQCGFEDKQKDASARAARAPWPKNRTHQVALSQPYTHLLNLIASHTPGASSQSQQGQAACTLTVQSVEIPAAAMRSCLQIRAREQEKVKFSRFVTRFSRQPRSVSNPAECLVKHCAQKRISASARGSREIFSQSSFFLYALFALLVPGSFTLTTADINTS